MSNKNRAKHTKNEQTKHKFFQKFFAKIQFLIRDMSSKNRAKQTNKKRAKHTVNFAFITSLFCFNNLTFLHLLHKSLSLSYKFEEKYKLIQS